MTQNDLAHQLRSTARHVTARARQRAVERTALLRTLRGVDPQTVDEDLTAFDRATADERHTVTAEARAAVAHYRTHNVMTRPPDYRPSSAAHASWVAAIASQAPHYSPDVMTRTIRSAIASNDTALVAALLPLAESLGSYRKEFVGKMSAVVIDGQDALRTPEVIASEQAAEWADAVDGEIAYLDAVLGNRQPIDSLDLNLSTGSFPNILPEGSA